MFYLCSISYGGKAASEIEEISNVIRRDETSDVDSVKGKMKLKTILLKIINKQLVVCFWLV